MAYHRIRQQVNAGKNFDGTPPKKEPAVSNDERTTFDPEDAGGEFAPGASTLRRIFLEGGNQSSCLFEIWREDNSREELLINSHPDRNVTWRGSVNLGARDKVVVTTRHGRQPMTCEVSVIS